MQIQAERQLRDHCDAEQHERQVIRYGYNPGTWSASAFPRADSA